MFNLKACSFMHLCLCVCAAVTWGMPVKMPQESGSFQGSGWGRALGSGDWEELRRPGKSVCFQQRGTDVFSSAGCRLLPIQDRFQKLFPDARMLLKLKKSTSLTHSLFHRCYMWGQATSGTYYTTDMFMFGVHYCAIIFNQPDICSKK